MVGLGAHFDGSGGGIYQLEWEMQKLRELRERMDLLHAFVRKHQLLLARLSWALDAAVLHPTKKENDHGVFVPQVELCCYAYNKQRVTALEIAALWPGAVWSRSMPRWGRSETERDYTADVDGVVIRIKNAEQKPRPKEVDHFPPCGAIRVPKANRPNNQADRSL